MIWGQLLKRELIMCRVNCFYVADDLSFQEVLNSFVKSMTANVGCLPNPCPNDEIPWPGYPDKCFQKTEKV